MYIAVSTFCFPSCLRLENQIGWHSQWLSLYSALSDINEFVSGTKCEFKGDAVNRMILNFDTPVYSAAISTAGAVFALSSNQKKLTKFILPNEASSKVYCISHIVQHTWNGNIFIWSERML